MATVIDRPEIQTGERGKTMSSLPEDHSAASKKVRGPVATRRRYPWLDIGLALALILISVISYLGGQYVRDRNQHGNLGDQFLQAGELTKAIEEYTKAVQCDPNSELSYLRRALAYFYQERWQEALADCNQAIALNPQSADAYWIRANVHARIGNMDMAYSDEQKSLQLNPNVGKQ